MVPGTFCTFISTLVKSCPWAKARLTPNSQDKNAARITFFIDVLISGPARNLKVVMVRRTILDIHRTDFKLICKRNARKNQIGSRGRPADKMAVEKFFTGERCRKTNMSWAKNATSWT